MGIVFVVAVTKFILESPQETAMRFVQLIEIFTVLECDDEVGEISRFWLLLLSFFPYP